MDMVILFVLGVWGLIIGFKNKNKVFTLFWNIDSYKLVDFVTG